MLPFVPYTHHWIGHPDCPNAAGVFVSISSLPRGEAVDLGVQWKLLVGAIASACTSAAEAVDLLIGMSHPRSMTYLIADRVSACAVEATPRGTVVWDR